MQQFIVSGIIVSTGAIVLPVLLFAVSAWSATGQAGAGGVLLLFWLALAIVTTLALFSGAAAGAIAFVMRRPRN